MMNARDIILAPVITEKAVSVLPEKKYTFRVKKDANKIAIKYAVEEIFGVTVVKVTTTTVHGKQKRTGRYPAGFAKTWKKAVVKLSEDSKNIEIFEGMA